MKTIKELVTFLNRLEAASIYYRLAKYNDEYIMVEVAVPGQHWEVEFSGDDVRIEKFITDHDLYGESEISVLFSEFSD